MTALNRDRIVASALAMIDLHGPDGLSMRKLAGRLDVTPMAIYKHLEDKQAVLDAVANRVMAEAEMPAVESPWQDRLAAVFTEVRAAYRRHPRAIVLVQTATRPLPALMAPMDAALAALFDADLPPRRAAQAWAALIGLTSGYVMYELNGHLEIPPDRRPSVDPDVHPNVARCMSAETIDWDCGFALALKSHITGLELVRSSPQATRR